MEIQDLTISGGMVESYDKGGGISNYGQLRLLRTTISGNSARVGGGIVNGYGAELRVEDSHITGNHATHGGGISNDAGYSNSNRAAVILRSTVSGNTSENRGGGISSFQTYTTVLESTISGNVAALGGGFSGYAEEYVDIRDSSITGNHGSGLTFEEDIGLRLFRSIVSGNNGPDIDLGVVRGRYVDIESASNVLGHSGRSNAEAFIGFTPGLTDIVATSDGTLPTALESILDPVLADNGGPTPTHALPLGSPAIDAIDTVCSQTDQRGVTRPQGSRCDIGAFELERSGRRRPLLSFATRRIEVPELRGIVRVNLEFSAPTTRRVVVPLIVGGSATRGTDFSVRDEIRIPPGVTEHAFDLRLRNDRIDEPNETVSLSLGEVRGAVPSIRAQTEVVILDEDPMPLVNFVETESEATETRRIKNVVVGLTRPSHRDQLVGLSYRGTAQRGVDFEGPVRITIPAGAMRAVTPVRLFNGDEPQDEETIEIEMIGFGDLDLEFGEEAGIGPGERTRHTLRLLSDE